LLLKLTSPLFIIHDSHHPAVAIAVAMGSTSPSYKGKEPAVLLELLDLPGEILSQIARCVRSK
jgi:hypothetical protein